MSYLLSIEDFFHDRFYYMTLKSTIGVTEIKASTHYATPMEASKDLMNSQDYILRANYLYIAHTLYARGESIGMSPDGQQGGQLVHLVKGFEHLSMFQNLAYTCRTIRMAERYIKACVALPCIDDATIAKVKQPVQCLIEAAVKAENHITDICTTLLKFN